MIKDQKDTQQNNESTLENLPPEIVYSYFGRFLSYHSTRQACLSLPFFRNVLSVHPIKKFCFKPQTRVSHNTHQTKVIYQWADKSMLQEVRIKSSPFYQHYLIDENNKKSTLYFPHISSFSNLSQNRITDFGIINENLFWIVFGGSYCAVVDKHSSDINTSGFFDFEVLAMCTDVIAFDGISTLYFSVKPSNCITYLAWNVANDSLSIIQNVESLNGLPVIRNGRPGYFSVLKGGDALKQGRNPLRRLIVTDKPHPSAILISSYLSIHDRHKNIWDNFQRNFSTQYHILSNDTALLLSPFGELVLHSLPTHENEKWSTLLFTFSVSKKISAKSMQTFNNTQTFSVSQDEKIIAILYKTNNNYIIHIWDLKNKQLLNKLSLPSSTFGKNSPSLTIRFENHNIIISDKSQHISFTFLFEQQSVDSTMSSSENFNPN